MDTAGKPYISVEIDGAKILDWPSFHQHFKDKLGFPSFYGRTMDGWIDCLTSIDDEEDGLSTVHAPRHGFLVLSVRAAKDLKKRCPDIYDALVECSAFVNFRRMEVGEDPVLLLSFHD
jgi:hypothetical protein